MAVLTLFNVKANAQISPTSPVVATIKIADLYAITLTDLAVEFDYESQAAFSATQAVTKPSHITVFSNRKYKIDVHASDDFKIGAATTNIISAGVLQVSVATPASAPFLEIIKTSRKTPEIAPRPRTGPKAGCCRKSLFIEGKPPFTFQYSRL